jgi:hypothetical protein
MMGSGGRRSGGGSDWEDRRYVAPVGGDTGYGETTSQGRREGGYSERAVPGMTGDQRFGTPFGTPYQGAPGRAIRARATPGAAAVAAGCCPRWPRP